MPRRGGSIGIIRGFGFRLRVQRLHFLPDRRRQRFQIVVRIGRPIEQRLASFDILDRQRTPVRASTRNVIT